MVSGVTPAARFWTLTLYDPKGQLVANTLQRYGFTSQEVIRGADGTFEIRVASRARAGNWLPTGGIERYALMLRLYDTPGRRRHAHPARRADAADIDGGLPMIRLCSPSSPACCSAASCISSPCWRCRGSRRRTPIRG